MMRQPLLHGVPNMRTDMSGCRAPRHEALQVRSGDNLTGSEQPLLREVRSALVHLSDLGAATVIDLRNISQPYNPTGQTKRGVSDGN